jgi:LysM domain
MTQTDANEGVEMSRDTRTTARCLAVWLVATAAAAATWWCGAGAAAALARAATWHGGFDELLVAVCGAVLLACGARLWWVTTVTTIDVVRGRMSHGAHGLTRRLVLAACGAAVVAGVSAPAVAGQGGDAERLAGLPLPDRATAGSTLQPGSSPSAARPAPTQHLAQRPGSGRDEVVVRRGDSLWALAAARLPRTAGPDEVDRAWRAVWAANRAEIGDDPGLIRPGQRLHLPETTGEDDR